MAWVTLLFLLNLWIAIGECVQVRATVNEGVLIGEKQFSSYNKTEFFSFRGIPYAKPPVRELRFKAPLPPDPYDGERDARDFGPMCVQPEMGTDRILGSEDCLYLNVYTPNLTPENPLPVIIYIPGKLYKTGSGDDQLFGPDYLVSFGVVLVTVNYRLGALGFLCVDTEDVPGNAGLKDQVQAMKWVQDNIEAFGGDPDQVTVYGQGAGGASVTLHLVSPLSAGLFNRAIATSGVFYCDWSSPYFAVKRAFGLGRNLGYITEDPDDLIDFLRSQPAERFVEVPPEILLSGNITDVLIKQSYYAPVREKSFGAGQFMTDNPVDLLRKGKVNKADILIGHTSKEALYNTYLNENLILDSYPFYYELYVPARITYFRSPAQNLRTSEAIQNRYFGDDILGLDTIRQFVDFYSTSIQHYPIHEFIEDYPKTSDNSRYFFRFDIYAPRNYFSKIAKGFGIRKATLGDDLAYVFDGELFYPKVMEDDEVFDLVTLMVTLFTNFAIFGTPTLEEEPVQWPQYNANREYVLITNNGLVPSQVTSFNGNGSLKFWRDLHNDAGVSFRDPWVIRRS